MSVDKTEFGLVLYKHADFNRFEETSSFWSVETNTSISFSLLFIGQPATHLLHHSVSLYSDQYRKHCAGSA